MIVAKSRVAAQCGCLVWSENRTWTAREAADRRGRMTEVTPWGYVDQPGLDLQVVSMAHQMLIVFAVLNYRRTFAWGRPR
jgi:hypothetical protein